MDSTIPMTTLDWIVISIPAVFVVVALLTVAIYEIFIEKHYD
jgi:hypothetical protein